MSSFFEAASHMKFSGGQSFNSANNIINNNFNFPVLSESQYRSSSSNLTGEEQWLTLRGGTQRLRVIDMCDINALEDVSTETRTLNALVECPSLKPTNPFIARLRRQEGSVKVRKTVQSVEIVQFGNRRFTVVTLEPEREEDAEKIRKVLQPLCETTLSSRQARLTQLFGVGRTATPTLIYHDEFVSVFDFTKQYSRIPIVFEYLWLKLWAAVDAVRDYETMQQLRILVSRYSRDWTFNLRTGAFQYDIITSITLFYAEDDFPKYQNSFTHWDLVHSFPPSSNLLRESDDIISAIPNFLALVSGTAYVLCVESLTDFVRHGVLTFGAVVDRTKPGILGHFPSITSPEWYCLPLETSDVNAMYSQSVPSLLHLTFKKETNIQMKLAFSLQSSKDRQRYQTSYMIQSFPFCVNCTKWDDLVFINDVVFCLNGTFTSNRSRTHSPVYLHVPPPSLIWVNGMPCLRWTSINEFFYWSFDPSGVTRIVEEDWELYGIPQLKISIYIGCSWVPTSYYAVQDYLLLKTGILDGVDFATRHEYPLLVMGDPHVDVGNEYPLFESKSQDSHLEMDDRVALIEYLKSPRILKAVSRLPHRNVIRVGEVYRRYGKRPAFRLRWYRRSSARPWDVVSRRIKALIRGRMLAYLEEGTRPEGRT